MAHYIAALDSGKGLTKLLMAEVVKGEIFEDIKQVGIDTRYTVLKDNETEDVTKNSYLIEFNGERVITGKQGNDISFKTDKELPIHRFCSYTAIAKCIEPNVEHTITLVLACPILIIKDSKKKEDYINFMTNNGELVDVTVDGDNYKFKFDHTIIKSEASGITYFDTPLFDNSRVLILDFGGLNMSALEYNDGVLNTKNRNIFDHGNKDLLNLLQTSLSSYRGQNLSRDTVETALNNGFLYLENGGKDTKSTSIINSTKEQFVYEAIHIHLESKSIFLADYANIIIVGGNSLHLSNQILDQIQNAVLVEDAQWACINGLFELAKEFAKSLCK